MFSKQNMLDKSSRGIGDEDISQLVDEIKKNPMLEILNLYRNNLRSKGLEQLVAVLPSMLRELNLGYNNFTDADLKLLEPLVKKGQLKKLNLSMNTGITNQSIPVIADWIKNYDVDVNVSHTKVNHHQLKACLKNNNMDKNNNIDVSTPVDEHEELKISLTRNMCA